VKPAKESAMVAKISRGTDADEFNRWRFADGRRYHLGAYLPFGMGPSVCVA
jgi:cytochrome P450